MKTALAASITGLILAVAQPADQGRVKASAREDGSFTVTNARNGFSKTYAAR